MSLNGFLEIKPKLIDNNNYYSGQIFKFELEFINQSDKELCFKDVNISFECQCSINLFHLKRFHKKNDVERILTYFKQLYNVTSNINENGYDKFQCLIIKTESLLFENKILNSKEIYKIPVKMRIPEESLPSYKSKYIHFHSFVKIIANFKICEIENQEIILPIIIKDHFLKDFSKTNKNDIEDSFLNNPFEIKEKISNDSLENELLSKLLLDKPQSSRYKITYRDWELCYLTLVKSQLSLGDDIKIVLNFVKNSQIRCVKFSISLKATENLLIPNDINDSEPLEVCLSTTEYGPFSHDSLCIEVYPCVIRMPIDQYPTLNFHIFRFDWFLDFKFIISDSKQISIDINAPPQKQPVFWTLKKEMKCELLKWQLPIRVYTQKLSEI